MESKENGGEQCAKVVKTVDAELMRERLQSACMPMRDRPFATQAAAIDYRQKNMRNSGFLVAVDKHTLKGGRVANPGDASHIADLMGKKLYYATDFDSIAAEFAARKPLFRNFYELASNSDPVHVYVDLDAGAGDAHVFESVQAFLDVEEEQFLLPFERFLVEQFGLSSAERDIERIVLDSCNPAKGKISRHYVWKMRGCMLCNNFQIGSLIKDFELRLMRSRGEEGLPHAPNNAWYKIDDKAPYPKFVFDDIYTSCRVYRSEGSTKFGRAAFLNRAKAGHFATDARPVTKSHLMESSIFFPSAFKEEPTIRLYTYDRPATRVVANAPKHIAHWPPEAFDGTEKKASDAWHRNAVVIEEDGSIGCFDAHEHEHNAQDDSIEYLSGKAHSAITAGEQRLAVGGSSFRSLVRNETSRLQFVPAAVRTILEVGLPHFRERCEFEPIATYAFNPVRGLLRIKTTNRYCPARAADTSYGTPLHSNNKTSIELNLRTMTVRWHCFSTNHPAHLHEEYLQRPYRAQCDDLLVNEREQSRAFLDELDRDNLFDAAAPVRLMLSQLRQQDKAASSSACENMQVE